jgi:hypothetical protein
MSAKSCRESAFEHVSAEALIFLASAIPGLRESPPAAPRLGLHLIFGAPEMKVV